MLTAPISDDGFGFAVNTIVSGVNSSATPTVAEIAAWSSLPGEEQSRLVREELFPPDARASKSDMVEISAKIKGRRAGR
jgi:hypothetical protein